MGFLYYLESPSENLNIAYIRFQIINYKYWLLDWLEMFSFNNNIKNFDNFYNLYKSLYKNMKEK